MNITLATTFHPRGEISRLQRLYVQLQAIYSAIIISLPPTTSPEDLRLISALPDVQTVINEDWSHGRHNALKKSLETDAQHIHYADMDRLLRWVETRPGEWQQTVVRVQQTDCLVIGRTEYAWNTHPRSMQSTEAISNGLVSHWLGKTLDISAGSKGFSRRAVEYIMANSPPCHAIGADAEWVVLLHRGGFALDTILVDGLDWEIADRYQDTAADPERQRQAAEAYDTDAKHWAWRVQILHEIIDCGMAAMQRPLVGV